MKRTIGYRLRSTSLNENRHAHKKINEKFSELILRDVRTVVLRYCRAAAFLGEAELVTTRLSFRHNGEQH